MRSVLLSLALIGGCNQTADAAKDAAKAVQDAADKSKDVAKAAVEDSKDAIDQAKGHAEAAGELSKTASNWLEEQSDSADGAIEAAIVKGKQITPVALEVGRVVNEAVDRDTVIEPIYQTIEAANTEEVDAAIESMPRVEVIDGLTVGFKQIDEMQASKHVKERGYLATWRLESHLVGFVYRSKRTINIDVVVREAPRLITLTRTALQDQSE